jgi:hypothetical protein
LAVTVGEVDQPVAGERRLYHRREAEALQQRAQRVREALSIQAWSRVGPFHVVTVLIGIAVLCRVAILAIAVVLLAVEPKDDALL